MAYQIEELEALEARLRAAQDHLEFVQDNFTEGRASQQAVLDAFIAMQEARAALIAQHQRDR